MKRVLYSLFFILFVVAGVWLIKHNYHKPVIRVKQINQLSQSKKIIAPLKLLNERYRVVITDKDYDIVVNGVFGNEDIKADQYKGAIKILYTPEAYLPNLDDYDLVLGFDRIDDPRYVRYPYYYIEWGSDIKFAKEIRRGQGQCTPNKKEFACFLVTNGDHTTIWRNGKPAEGTKARDSMFHKLSEYKWVASGGKHLNNIGGPVPRGKKNTQEWLSQCKFIISYENQYHNGYITEKVFQAYFAGAIPIYWSDQTAVTDINKDAVIYANDFDSEDDIIDYIKKVDNDDDLYCKIWNQPLVTNPEIDIETTKEKLRKRLFELIDAKFKK